MTEVRLIDGGNATIYVSDMERAIAFYTETLGLALRMRAESYWAEVDAGPGLVIGLHPETPPHTPKAGTRGATRVGLNVARPLEEVVAELERRGVTFDGPIVDDGGAVRLAYFDDPDGNPLYLSQLVYEGSHEGS